jgi:hypothetical protein
MSGAAIKSKSPLFARLPQLEIRGVQGTKTGNFTHVCAPASRGEVNGGSLRLITGPNELAEPKTAAPVRDPLVMNSEQASGVFRVVRRVGTFLNESFWAMTS